MRTGGSLSPGRQRSRVPVPSGVTCLVCFLVAICFTLQSGNYWLEIFDNFTASMNLLVFAFFEVVGVAYVYGMEW